MIIHIKELFSLLPYADMMATIFLADEYLFLIHLHIEDLAQWDHDLFPGRPITLSGALCFVSSLPYTHIRQKQYWKSLGFTRK